MDPDVGEGFCRVSRFRMNVGCVGCLGMLWLWTLTLDRPLFKGPQLQTQKGRTVAARSAMEPVECMPFLPGSP